MAVGEPTPHGGRSECSYLSPHPLDENGLAQLRFICRASSLRVVRSSSIHNLLNQTKEDREDDRSLESFTKDDEENGDGEEIFSHIDGGAERRTLTSRPGPIHLHSNKYESSCPGMARSPEWSDLI